MCSALFYGRLFDISINILSMCFTETSEICPMSWRNRFCSSSLSKDLRPRVIFSCSLSVLYRVSTVSKLASFCPASALSIYSVVQLSPGALEAHATVLLVYSINVIDFHFPLPHATEWTFPAVESFVLLFGFYVLTMTQRTCLDSGVLRPKPSTLAVSI